MKKLFYLLICFLSLNAFGQITFGPVEKHGFGQLQGGIGYNSSIVGMKAFKGKLYVGMGEDSGYVYRSATGDLGSFQKVFSEASAFGMGHFEVTNDAGGYLYAATNTDYGYFHRAKRTSDGLNWEDYIELPSAYDRVVAINAFKGVQAIDSIYLSVRTSGGFNLLLRNSVDQNDPYNSGLTWDTVATEASVFGSAGQVTSSIVFNNKLYYATDNNELYETTDGRSLSSNTNYYNQMGYGGFSGVDRVTSMEVMGSYLYFGTYTSFGGAQLWRTADGVTFDSLGVLNSSMPSLVSMKTAGAKLYMIVSDYGGYYEIYSTVDGTTFVLEDNTEFGDYNTNMIFHSNMEVFNNHLYVGTTQDLGGLKLVYNNNILNTNSSGAQIYRTCLVGSMPSVSIIEGDTVTVCYGVSATLTATGASTYLWNNANTSPALSTTQAGYYSVTGISVAGCRNSDDACILNPNSPGPVVYSNNYQIGGEVVCIGDTTDTLIALNPANDFSSLQTNSLNGGFEVPVGAPLSGSDLTIEAWIKPTSSGVIASEFDPSGNWGFNNFGIMRIGGFYSDEFYVELPGVGSTFVGYINTNDWTHVALRYNATTKVLDGLINAAPGGYAYTGAAHETPSSVGYSDGFKFMYETYNPYYEQNAQGKIRDVRIWNIARTDSAIYADKHQLPAGPHPNLINHYLLNEGSGTMANDLGQYNLNSTVAGTFLSPTPVTWLANPTMNVVGFNSAVVFPTEITHYAIQFTDDYGCLVVDSFKVEPAMIKINPSSMPVSCGGSTAFLNYIANVDISIANWNSITVGSVSDTYVNLVPPVDEWVYVSDNSTGCLLQDSVLVKVGPAFTTSLPSKGPGIHVCENSDYTIDALASGGTAPFTFLWNIDNLPTDTTNSSLYTFNVGTTYHNVDVYGHDAIGCPFEGAYLYILGDLASTDLSGHVSTPAPSSLSVDNGFVYVFKHQPGNAGFDTIGYVPLDGSGNYLFSALTAGDYLIKALPDEIDFPNAVPTYNGNVFQWDSTTAFAHGCDVNYTMDIEVLEVSGETGTASISGYIIEEEGFGNNRYAFGNGNYTPFVPGGPLKGIDVKLGKNPGGGIQARTMTDSTGFYVFDSIPEGGYKIYVDIPNLPMDSTRTLTVAPGDSSIQNNYYADSASIFINPEYVGIYASEKQYKNGFTIYPNPAKEKIYLNYELKEKSLVRMEITNAMGQLMYVEQEKNYVQGVNSASINIQSLHLTGGVYFVSIITGKEKYTQRIVIIQ